MVKTIDATTTDRLRRSPLYLDLSPSCARKRACMELTTICRFQRLNNPSFRLFQCFRRKLVPTLWCRFSCGEVGLDEFGAEGVVVAEVFEVGGGGGGFEGGGVGGEGIVAAHHTL